MIFRIFKTFSTAKTIYNRVLKPIYEELRKDAYASDNTEPIKRKEKTITNKAKKKSNPISKI